MCDYSLMHFPNRLATEGEELIAHRFPSGSVGLTSPAELENGFQERPTFRESIWAALKDLFVSTEGCCITAVCIPPGACLRLRNIDEYQQRQYGIESEEEVIFDQLAAGAYEYRDAIVFRTGLKLKLQELREGQRIKVLSLAPVEASAPDQREEVAARRPR